MDEVERLRAENARLRAEKNLPDLTAKSSPDMVARSPLDAELGTGARATTQRTHHAECWRDPRHHGCAVARIEMARTAIQFRIDQICRREGISEATKEHEVAPEVAAEINALQYARLCWERAMSGERSTPTQSNTQ
jgi:hypothetical protein